MKILVTAIGSFSAEVVIKNLNNKGHKVVGCDIHPKEWIANAYIVKKFYQAPYATEKGEYLKFIKNIAKKELVDVILPLTDVEIDVLNDNREQIESADTKIGISGENSIRLCRDKKALAFFLSKKNICTTIETRDLKDLEFEDLQFPMVCKPINGRSSQGLKYINSFKEMRSFISAISDIKIEEYIVQPYIQGEIITVDVLRDRKTNRCITCARKELLRTPNGAGTSVYVFRDTALEKRCIEMAKVLDINGFFNFEFIYEKKNDLYYFIECNPRFSGGIKFSCIAGYDFIVNHLNCFVGNDIEQNIQYKNQFIARKYEEYVTKIEK